MAAMATRLQLSHSMYRPFHSHYYDVLNTWCEEQQWNLEKCRLDPNMFPSSGRLICANQKISPHAK